MNFRKLYKSCVISFMNSKLYSWLLFKIIPYIRFTTYYTTLRGWKYRAGYVLLRKGDIILTVDRKKLTSLLIPGMFSHAALCVGTDSDWEISEMTHDHYTKSCFFDICKESDQVVILRCRDWSTDYIEHVVNKCKGFQDAQYDKSFELGIKALYCSELVYLSDFSKYLQVDLSDLIGLGQPYISPDDLYRARNCDIVWDSDQEIIPSEIG